MPRKNLGKNVFENSIDRMYGLYKEGHRIVVSFSGGKDSTALIEVCVIAARMAGRLPVEAVLRDEEIMFPGTYEFLDRVAHRDDVRLTHLCSRHGISNVFNRANPFWYAHDPRVHPSVWVREPPDYALVIDEPDIERMTVPERFPPPPGKDLIAAIGLRTTESQTRRFVVYSIGSFLARKLNRWGVRNAYPIYDWCDNDVWRVIKELKLDYNEAYNVLFRMGEVPSLLRTAPPTLNILGVKKLTLAMKAWPNWFDKVCKRVEGVRTVAQFGKRAVQPERRLNETWKDTFERECIENAPLFVRERAEEMRRHMLNRHAKHSVDPFPEVAACKECWHAGSWKKLTFAMYNGDPLASKTGNILPNMETEIGQPWLKEGHPAWMRGDNLLYGEWKKRAEQGRSEKEVL